MGETNKPNGKKSTIMCPGCGRIGPRLPDKVVACPTCKAKFRMLPEPAPFGEEIGEVEFNMLQDRAARTQGIKQQLGIAGASHPVRKGKPWAKN